VTTEEEQPTVLEKEHFKEEITISSEMPTDVDKIDLEVEVPKEDSQLEEEQVKETEETVTFETEEEIPESVTEKVVVVEEFPEAVQQELPRPEETTETVVRESFVHEKPDITETFTKEITISPKPTTEEVVLGFEGPTDVSSQDETVEVLEEEHFKEEITVSPEKSADVDETVFEVQVPKEAVPEEDEDFEVATAESSIIATPSAAFEVTKGEVSDVAEADFDLKPSETTFTETAEAVIVEEEAPDESSEITLLEASTEFQGHMSTEPEKRQDILIQHTDVLTALDSTGMSIPSEQVVPSAMLAN